MSEQRYDVVYAGAIKEGFSQVEVKAIFVLKFKLSTEKVERYFSGKRMILKRSLTKTKAENLKGKLMGIGAEALIVPCIDAVDTNRAIAKNKRHQQISQVSSQVKEEESKNIVSIDSYSSESKKSDSDKELNQKIRLAQSMMIEQQLKSQISESKLSPKYNKLILLLFILGAAVGFLYYLGKNSI